MAAPSTTARLWTPEQLAKSLQISRKTVYRRIHAGDIYAKRIGRALRIPEAVVVELLNA